jgi:hypothetical protein
MFGADKRDGASSVAVVLVKAARRPSDALRTFPSASAVAQGIAAEHSWKASITLITLENKNQSRCGR